MNEKKVSAKQKKIETPEHLKKKPKFPEYDGSLHVVKFNYMEQPGQFLEFTFLKSIWIEHKQRGGHEALSFKMKDGQIYELPKFIIDHLHEKTVPAPSFEKMSDGTLKEHSRSYRNRFGLIPVPRPEHGEVSDGRVIKGKK